MPLTYTGGLNEQQVVFGIDRFAVVAPAPLGAHVLGHGAQGLLGCKDGVHRIQLLPFADCCLHTFGLGVAPVVHGAA